MYNKRRSIYNKEQNAKANELMFFILLTLVFTFNLFFNL